MKVWIAFAASVIVLLCASSAQADDADDCHVGAYRLTDGRLIDIASSDPNPLRWRAFSGQTGALRKNADGSWTSILGWTERPDGRTVSFPDCATGNIRFDGTSGQRIDFDVKEMRAAAKAAGWRRLPQTARTSISSSSVSAWP